MAHLHTIRNLLLLTDGQDKGIKVVQYSSRLFVWLFLYRKRKDPSLEVRLRALATQFSTTRKVLTLGNPVPCISALLDIRKKWSLKKRTGEKARDTKMVFEFLLLLVSFANAVFDDVYCLGRIGVLSKEWQRWAERKACICWLVKSIFSLRIALREKRRLERLLNDIHKMPSRPDSVKNENFAVEQMQFDDFWQSFVIMKLCADIGFNLPDVFLWNIDEGFQILLGLSSGFLSFFRLYAKTQRTLLIGGHARS